MARITFLGNFEVSYSSETHHANSLEDLGHKVIRLQENRDNADVIVQEATYSDLFIWIHTHGWRIPDASAYSGNNVIRVIKERKIPVITYHLDLWKGISREKDLEQDPFYKQLDYFFATDKLMCDWFNETTNVKGVYLTAGVYDKECYISENKHEKSNDVIFVGSKGYHSEWSYRPKLIEWLRITYLDRFTHVGGDGDTGTIRGKELNAMYAGSKIAVGDSLCIDYSYPYYWSDRVYETMGRGGFLIMPYIQGLEEHFEDGKHLVYYEFNDFKQLQYLINYYLEHDIEREKIRKAGHELVKSRDTYKHRWEYIIDTVLGNKENKE